MPSFKGYPSIACQLGYLGPSLLFLNCQPLTFYVINAYREN